MADDIFRLTDGQTVINLNELFNAADNNQHGIGLSYSGQLDFGQPDIVADDTQVTLDSDSQRTLSYKEGKRMLRLPLMVRGSDIDDLQGRVADLHRFCREIVRADTRQLAPDARRAWFKYRKAGSSRTHYFLLRKGVVTYPQEWFNLNLVDADPFIDGFTLTLEAEPGIYGENRAYLEVVNQNGNANPNGGLLIEDGGSGKHYIFPGTLSIAKEGGILSRWVDCNFAFDDGVRRVLYEEENQKFIFEKSAANVLTYTVVTTAGTKTLTLPTTAFLLDPGFHHLMLSWGDVGDSDLGTNGLRAWWDKIPFAGADGGNGAAIDAIASGGIGGRIVIGRKEDGTAPWKGGVDDGRHWRDYDGITLESLDDLYAAGREPNSDLLMTGLQTANGNDTVNGFANGWTLEDPGGDLYPDITASLALVPDGAATTNPISLFIIANKVAPPEGNSHLLEVEDFNTFGSNSTDVTDTSRSGGHYVRSANGGTAATPAAPTLAITGGAAGSYSYQVVNRFPLGDTAPSTAGTTAVGPTTLDSTHYIDITFAELSGALDAAILWNTTRYQAAAPSLSVTGGAAGAYTYGIIPVFPDTDGGPTTGTSTAVGPTTLDSTHYVDVSWTAIPDAIAVRIWKGTNTDVLTTIAAGTTTYRDNGTITTTTPYTPLGAVTQVVLKSGLHTANSPFRHDGQPVELHRYTASAGTEILGGTASIALASHILASRYRVYGVIRRPVYGQNFAQLVYTQGIANYQQPTAMRDLSEIPTNIWSLVDFDTVQIPVWAVPKGQPAIVTITLYDDGSSARPVEWDFLWFAPFEEEVPVFVWNPLTFGLATYDRLVFQADRFYRYNGFNSGGFIDAAGTMHGSRGTLRLMPGKQNRIVALVTRQDGAHVPSDGLFLYAEVRQRTLGWRR